MFDRYYCIKTENICYISRYFLHYFVPCILIRVSVFRMMKLPSLANQNAHNGDSDHTARTKAGRVCPKVRFLTLLISWWFSPALFNTMRKVGKGPYVICEQWRSRLACSSLQSDLDILSLSTYTTVSIDSIGGQRRPRSASAYAQADQGLFVRK